MTTKKAIEEFSKGMECFQRYVKANPDKYPIFSIKIKYIHPDERLRSLP